jgi:spermidine synthase
VVQSSSIRWVFVALFFATGISGLGYQVLWAKSFAAGVGHEFPAVLAVVTAFMGGIALGAGLYGRWRALRSYGWLELAIGIWGAATIVVIPAANRLTIEWLGPEPSAGFHWFVVFAMVFLVLAPATIAMGATFPAIQVFAVRMCGGRNVGLLYAANTAGAMAGALASAFWLMPRFGIPQSILILAGINLACGVAALAVMRYELALAPALRERVDPRMGPRLFLTGFFGIAFEIVMIRGLSQALENTVFTFAALIATYLCATALGAAWFQRTERPRDVRWLLAGLALACVAGGLTLRWIPELYGFLRASLGDSLPRVAVAEILAAAAVLFLPALVMGATFAALAEGSLRGKPNLSWSLALNTSGAALAPAAFGLFVLPRFGVNGAILLIAIGYAALIGKSRLLWVLVPVAVAALFLPSGSDLVRLKSGERVVFYKEGATAATSVIETANGARVLKVNSRFQMGGTAARVAEQRHADIPLLLHPAPRRALFIGLGTGITFGTAAYYPDLQAEGVELLPAVAEAMPLFAEDPRRPVPKVHIADGRRFILSSREPFDVIVGDLFHPAQDGAGFLFTREHFTAIRSRLAEGGLFCQWLPVFQMDVPTLQIIARTFLEVFPNAEAWVLRFNVDTPVIGLIARPGAAPLTPTWVEDRLASPALAEHLRRVALADSVRLFGCFLAGPNPLRDFASTAAINTDTHPIVMFQAPRLAFQSRDDASARLLELLKRFDSDNSLHFEDSAFFARVSNFIAARDTYLHGLVLEAGGDPSRAAAQYLAAARRSADFTPAYAQSLALASAMAGSHPEAAERILQGLVEARPDIPVASQLLERLKD